MEQSIQQSTTYIVDSRGRKRENLVGRRFGYLLVKEFVGFLGNRNACTYLCVCKCGNSIKIPSHKLIHRNVKSCGCLAHEQFAKFNSLPPGEAVKRGVYRLLQRNAEKRGIEFHLTLEQSVELGSKNCHYCGKSPMLVGTKRNTVNGNWFHSSIDRIDSSKGYTFDNCVPSCYECNVAKSDMADWAYIEHCRKVVEHFNKTQQSSTAA